MAQRKSFIIIFTILLYAYSNAIASVEFVRSETIGLISEGVKAILRVSNGKEKEVIKNINFLVPIDCSPARVRAFNRSTSRYIEVSTGYSVLSRMIVSAFVIASKYEMSDFGNEYAEYTAHTYGTGRIEDYIPPWEKAGLSKIEQKKLLNDPEFNAVQHGEHAIVIWYVIAHEIAHHVLKHNFDRSISITEIQRQEKEADKWASETFIKLGIPPSAAFPAQMYWYYLDQNSIRNEHQRTHPSDLRRIRWMIQLTLQNIDTWNSNGHLFPSLYGERLTKMISSQKRFLVYVEDLMSKQLNLKPGKNTKDKFDICMEIMFEKCLTSCQDEYHHSLRDCENKY